ncbi:N-acetylmuramoyl-L-alanine amidase [Paenibacillus tarimensis]
MRRIVLGALAIIMIVIVILPEPAIAEAGTYYKVVADSLNVREQPDPEANVVGSVKAGDLVVVSDERFGWMKVRASDVSGWVAGYYLRKTNGTAAVAGKSDKVQIASAEKQATVLADAVRFREGPGTGYNVIGSVNKGDGVTVLGSEGGWVRARIDNGTIGWISAQYVGGAQGGASSRSLRGKVIVIDPGHGGDDPGMIGTKLETLEKELTLSTSTLLADRLRAMGAKVILTRTKDVKPKLSERVSISESAGADAFVSVHYNSAKGNTSGTLTFYYSKNKDESLARAIEGRLAKGIGLKSNGISFGDLYVLRENDTPAALVELGFLSNEKDEKLVRTDSYQRDAADAIAAGLADYFE